ncbi:MAG: hypothetical protein IJM85_00745 [Clostridia bacterium]|nr:hypothetical protein [Clostridia bacterium]
MKTAIKILWGAVIALVVLFIGDLIWSYADFKLHPEKIGVQSAPWYTGPIIWGGISLILIIIFLLLIVVLKRKGQK